MARIAIDPELWRRTRMLAFQTGQSGADIVTEALRRYLDETDNGVAPAAPEEAPRSAEPPKAKRSKPSLEGTITTSKTIAAKSREGRPSVNGFPFEYNDPIGDETYARRTVIVDDAIMAAWDQLLASTPEDEPINRLEVVKLAEKLRSEAAQKEDPWAAITSTSPATDLASKALSLAESRSRPITPAPKPSARKGRR